MDLLSDSCRILLANLDCCFVRACSFIGPSFADYYTSPTVIQVPNHQHRRGRSKVLAPLLSAPEPNFALLSGDTRGLDQDDPHGHLRPPPLPWRGGDKTRNRVETVSSFRTFRD